jgi:enoyl-CoA hydratase/carnithine racemase
MAMTEAEAVQPLLWERQGPIGVLTLNRPERLNALDHGLVHALLDFFAARMTDYTTRVIIVTGAGRAFCAGLDLKARGKQGAWHEGVGPVQDAYAFQEAIAEVIVRMRRCPQPLIAAVNGAAAGGGFSIALACDIRFGSPAARFACSFLNLGLGGGDMGSSYFLPRLAGAAHAADLLYSGRIVEAEEAFAMGLLNRIVPAEELLDVCLAQARGMVERASPLGLRLTKEVLNETVAGISLETALKLENRNQILAAQTADATEAARAWLERRAPLWRDA